MTTRGPKRLAMLLTGALILTALGACAVPRTAIDYDPGVDFGKYRTYQWIPADAVGLEDPEDPRLSPLAPIRTRAAVDQVLLTKGYVRTTPPDFFITLRTGLHDSQFVDHWGPSADPLLWRHGWRYRPYGPFGYDPFFDPFFGRTVIRTVTEGTHAIDMFDAKTKRPIWHGHVTRPVARDDIHPADIQRLVDAVLADFPPGSLSPPGTMGVADVSLPQ